MNQPALKLFIIIFIINSSLYCLIIKERNDFIKLSFLFLILLNQNLNLNIGFTFESIIQIQTLV
jgi:hypothetical protein